MSQYTNLRATPACEYCASPERGSLRADLALSQAASGCDECLMKILAAAPERPRRTRERLSTTRPARTLHIEMQTADGPLDAYATVGVYPDGRPGELFLTVKGPRDYFWVDLFAVAFSVALQHGAPLSTLTDKLRGSRADPVGRLVRPESLVADGGRLNVSLADVLARWLQSMFPA